MRNSNLLVCLVAAGMAFALPPGRAAAQTVYSFTDDNGVRIYTNVPPKTVPSGTTTIAIRTTDSSKDVRVYSNVPPKAAPNGMAKIAVRPQDSPDVARTRPPAGRGEGGRGGAGSEPKKPGAASFDGESLDAIIQKHSTQQALDPALVRSVIAAESAFNPRAVSSKGARGLMQLMPATAARLGVTNSFDPDENIGGGTKHLRTLLDTFNNDLSLSLAAYNAGENLVLRLGRVPNIPETKGYIRQVVQGYGRSELPRPDENFSPKPLRLYEFIDAGGVRHLTNVPPSRLQEGLQILPGFSESSRE